MIVIGICILVGFCLGYLDGWIEDAIVGGMWGAVLGFIISMIVGGIAYHDTVWRERAIPLVSLNDGSTIHGRFGGFFIMSGSLDGEPSFTWYEKNGPNSYVRKSADADMSTVHYLTEDRAPYYLYRERVYPGSFLHPWAVNVNAGSTDETHYDFYVPKGSIKQEYVLDNQ